MEAEAQRVGNGFECVPERHFVRDFVLFVGWIRWDRQAEGHLDLTMLYY